ncbi:MULTISPECIES: glutamate ABC transporter substrate-binding protein [Subtercola]|uniref:Glutamate ABC transporter substrate-binding protein n=1 Tax=Subtercola vilae TaxID=2056433 RepID=A0A4T2BZQ3_9MICO|nr:MULTISPECIES: glutamate ABC transporter substrate-binding protein [Subtercola]MEA9985078.1 glutamate ABC transporter substrate-binding protein [Subtercola sp. RTI3]TIH37100.1 glutamate ABC transporter substrate-binding protein [Subtercola vilae]
MPSTRKTLTRGIPLLAITVTAALAFSACSSDSSAVPTSNPTSSASNALSSVYSNAAVASAADLIPDSTMAKIKARGKLIVAEALDAPLLSQQDPSNPDNVEGFDADLAKLLAIYILGTPSVEIIPPASETREALLQNGTVDVVFNTYTITTERDAQVDFAGPYLQSGLAVAVKSDNTSIQSVSDLGGKTVIVGANTPAVTAVPEQQPTAKVVSFATDPEAVLALTQGRGDAYVQDFTLLASDAASNKAIKVVGQPFTTESYGIGLKNNDTQFKSFINAWLTKIEASGDWAKVWNATLGSAVTSSTPTPPAIGSVPGS